MRILTTILAAILATTAHAELERIVVSKDGRGFQRAESGRPFVPWGHNYPAGDRLLEDYWETKWETVAEDFGEMRDIGTNVVRVHLQLVRFMDAADRPNAKAFAQLRKLIGLAEETGVYLDITGLACYRPTDAQEWYDQLSRDDRWKAQASFWAAVAETCAKSPAIFCYDLMNEPVVAAENRKPGQWRSGKHYGGFDFVQYISLDKPDKPRHEIAVNWIKTLSAAIRAKDKQHLITVGMLPSTKAWGHFSGFVPEKVAPELDFLCVHVYPESGKLDEAQTVVKQFAVGKPLVLEETFNLTCTAPELREFLLASRGMACGWVGHYHGDSLADLEAAKKSGHMTIPQSMQRDWLGLFKELGPQMK